MIEIKNTFNEFVDGTKDVINDLNDKLISSEDTLKSEIQALKDELSELKSQLFDPIDVKINYHREKYPDLKPVEKHGNFYDLRSAESMKLKKHKQVLIPLGISMYIPDGYYAEILPRSSTFKNYKFFVANSMGIVDDTYRSLEDEWFLSVYTTKRTKVEVNDRIAQFTLVKEVQVNLSEDVWEAPKRGGNGSSGIK